MYLYIKRIFGVRFLQYAKLAWGVSTITKIAKLIDLIIKAVVCTHVGTGLSNNQPNTQISPPYQANTGFRENIHQPKIRKNIPTKRDINLDFVNLDMKKSSINKGP